MAAPVRVGEVLADKYEVTKILGEGGMGVVVAARHLELDKLVALKFMHEELARSGNALDRFLREARAAARLTNEHVGRVLDVGRLGDGTPYIVMEYLEGRDLGELLAQRGTLDVADACEYVLQSCEAMAEAHAQGIIHRDLKPQNLFLTTRQDGRPLVKVLDFGISKAHYAKGPTATNTMMGTPTHMSPEQMRSSRTVDPRADIWSLGVILYQLLSGKLPFDGETVTETMVKVLHDPPPSLAAARPGLPPALVAAVEKCLDKDRTKRFENVAELAHALTPFAPDRARAAISLIERVMSAGASPSAPRAPAPDDDVVPAITAAPSTLRSVKTTLGNAAGESIGVPRGGSRRWLVVVPIVLVVAVGITIGVVRRDGDSVAPSGPVAVSSDAPATGDLAASPREAAATDAAPDAPVVETAAVDAAVPDARRRSPVDAGARTSVDARGARPTVDTTPELKSTPIDAWTPEPPRLPPDAGLDIPR